jgi:type IV secretory pathway VirB10-like protein
MLHRHPYKGHTLGHVLRMGFLLGAVIATVAVSACGGEGSDDKAPTGVASNTDSQAGTTGTTAEPGSTGPTGPSAPKRSPATESKRKKSPEDQSRSAGDDSRAAGRTQDNARNTDKEQRKTDKEKQGKQKPKSAWDIFSTKDLYEQGRVACRTLGLERLAIEYEAPSRTAGDVAKVYADAYIRGGAPERVWKPIYEGCAAGLTGH